MRYALITLFITTTLFASDDIVTAVRANDVTKVQALLADDPSLIQAKFNNRSVTTIALFAGKGGFQDAKKNEVLKIVLKHKPKLDGFESAALGDATEFAKLLDREPMLVHARNAFGWTALHMAAFAGNLANVKLLLDRGADIHDRAKTKFLNTPLLVATLTGQYDVAKLLLDRGADVLVRQSLGYTPLHEAALLGRMDLVQLYLDHGAELNSRTDDGRTPLSEATRGKHDDVAAFLKTKGAVMSSDPNVLESPD